MIEIQVPGSTRFALCSLCVLRVLCVECFPRHNSPQNTENAEVAQRSLRQRPVGDCVAMDLNSKALSIVKLFRASQQITRSITDERCPRGAARADKLRSGDARSFSIAAASVLAKVTRDRLMFEYDRRYPDYGFAEHKGYGTAGHLAAIAKYGVCPIHRRSFAPVRGQPNSSSPDSVQI